MKCRRYNITGYVFFALVVGLILLPASAMATQVLSSDGELVEVTAPAPSDGTLIPPEFSTAEGLYFSEDWNEQGLYRLDTATGAATNIGVSGVTGATVGLAPSNNTQLLYGSKWSTLLEINTDGSGYTDVGGTGTEGLAWDGQTLYGAINGAFFTVNPATGEKVQDLAAPGSDVEGLAFCSIDGYVYGLADGGELLKYNTTSGTWTSVGNTGIAFDQCGLACDPSTGKLYAKGDQDSNLYAIDRGTAATTIIGDTGIAEGGGLAFVGEGQGSCTLDLALTYTENNTFTMDFTLGMSQPATLNVWLSFMNQIVPLLSLPLPAFEPAISFPISLPNFPHLGNMGVLTTLTSLTTLDGILCSDWETVNTGAIGTSIDEEIEKLKNMLQ